MTRRTLHPGRFGLVLALAALCCWWSVATLDDQSLGGAAGGRATATMLAAEQRPAGGYLVLGRDSAQDREFTAALAEGLRAAGITVVDVVNGGPPEIRAAIERHGVGITAEIVCAVTPEVAEQPVLGTASRRAPPLRRFPTFLKRENLINIANQIVVIAILAAGMTLVILTGGIDLSVGSLIALSAVICALVIGRLGGETASPLAMLLGAAAAIAACAGVGLLSGTMITGFRLPPFIATLGMMQVASGLAFILARGQSVYQVPDSFVWLGRGADLLGLPNAVLLMLGIYAAVHLVASRTRFGRSVYAVGGNPEAARLSGVATARITRWVYLISGALAGLGGVVMASQLKSGAPTYGGMYELFVIAAVVVGGTSLTGGSGTVGGTLLGALLIAVIQNGMNLTGVESYTQKVVLGLVILGAVLLDQSRRRG